jgi:hypothetical protein
MGAPPDSPPRMPWYLEMAIRSGTSPVEWPDAIQCYERVYAALVTKDGLKAAKLWAVRNTAWLVGMGAVSMFR